LPTAAKTPKQPVPVETVASETPERTVIGWQGIRFTLPPEWNVTGFSMDRDNGYLRVDSPGSGTLSVLVRWQNAAKPDQGPPTLYTLLAPGFRKWLRRPEPEVPKPDLKANLEKILKDAQKQAKKAKAHFESSVKAERTEGENEERTSISFSWTGGGRGQGKIWYCATCKRVVVAQVVGLQKDHGAISAIASHLFSTLQDHAMEGYDLWALYDLNMEVPDDFQLESQELKSGYLHLSFGRGGERIILDRWGLANITLKKFTREEWFANNAYMSTKKLSKESVPIDRGHEATKFAGALSFLARLRLLREAKLSLKRFPTRYEGGIWHCEESNKLFAVQVLHNKRTEGLWTEVVRRCLCH